jgi:hypothetical protein
VRKGGVRRVALCGVGGVWLAGWLVGWLVLWVGVLFYVCEIAR